MCAGKELNMVMCQLHKSIDRVLLMVLFSGMCFTQPVFSQDGAGSGSIVGEVLDGMTGDPLVGAIVTLDDACLLYTSPSPRD